MGVTVDCQGTTNKLHSPDRTGSAVLECNYYFVCEDACVHMFVKSYTIYTAHVRDGQCFPHYCGNTQP